MASCSLLFVLIKADINLVSHAAARESATHLSRDIILPNLIYLADTQLRFLLGTAIIVQM